jgi:hypothetical protein
MTIGRQLPVASTDHRAVAPPAGQRVKLRHRPSGQELDVFPIDAREILAAEDTEYEFATAADRKMLEPRRDHDNVVD